MFRLQIAIQRTSIITRLNHSSAAIRRALTRGLTFPPPTQQAYPSVKTQQNVSQPRYNPKDWYIVETAPGGLELAFANRKTCECTGYAPEGMSAAEMFAIPGAKNYWTSVEDVEGFIEQMAIEQKEDEALLAQERKENEEREANERKENRGKAD